MKELEENGIEAAISLLITPLPAFNNQSAVAFLGSGGSVEYIEATIRRLYGSIPLRDRIAVLESALRRVLLYLESCGGEPHDPEVQAAQDIRQALQGEASKGGNADIPAGTKYPRPADCLEPLAEETPQPPLKRTKYVPYKGGNAFNTLTPVPAESMSESKTLVEHAHNTSDLLAVVSNAYYACADWLEATQKEHGHEPGWQKCKKRLKPLSRFLEPSPAEQEGVKP